jgi:HEAT repeat protein
MRFRHLAIFLVAVIAIAAVALVYHLRHADDREPATVEDGPKAEPFDLEERILKASKVDTDDASLLALLKKHSANDADLQRIDALVCQLGSDDFSEREQASSKLKALGLVAASQLYKAQTHQDPEIASRAKSCLQQVERDARAAPPLMVVRLLLRRHPSGLGEALLQYLPFATEEDVVTECMYGLNRLAEQDDKTRAALDAALKDQMPARRAAAACILCRIGSQQQRTTVKELLKDQDSTVRLRAAQGLLASRDKAAVPVLIALLDEPSVTISWQAEELLHWAAGEDAPDDTIGAASPESRKKCRAAWASWWAKLGKNLDLKNGGQDRRCPSLLLVSEESSGSNQFRLWLCGCDGRPRWQLPSLERIQDVQLLPDNRILLGEFVDPGRAETWGTESPIIGRVTERDLHGKVCWQREQHIYPEFARRLPSGNVVIAQPGGFTEIQRGGKVVHTYKQGRDSWLCLVTMQMLDGSHFLCKSRDEDACKLLIVELGQSAYRVVNQIDLQVADPGRFEAEMLPNGYVLLVANDPRRLKMIGNEGRVAWESKGAEVSKARSHRAGTKLVLRDASGRRLVEINQADKVIWETFTARQIRRFWPCLETVGLGFQACRRQDLDLDSVANRIEGLKHRNPLFRWGSASALAGLCMSARPAVPALIEALDDSDPAVREAAHDTLSAIDTPVPALLEALKHKSANVRAGAADLLGSVDPGASGVLSHLTDASKDADATVREHALTSLGQLARKDQRALPPLIDGLQDREPKVRCSVLSWIANLGIKGKASLPKLLKAMKDPDPDVRYAAAGAIAKVGPADKRVLAALMDTLKTDRSLHARAGAALGLADLGTVAEPAISLLIEALNTRPGDDPWYASELRGNSALALGWIGPAAKIAVPKITSIAVDHKALHLERDFALRALGQLGPAAKDAVPSLILLLKEKPTAREPAPEFRVRLEAIFVLGKIGRDAKEAIPVLFKLRDDWRYRPYNVVQEALDAIQ